MPKKNKLDYLIKTINKGTDQEILLSLKELKQIRKVPTDEKGKTILHSFACRADLNSSEHIGEILDLIGKKCLVNENKFLTCDVGTANGATPLHYAAFYGCYNIAKAIIDRLDTTKVNCINDQRVTPLHYACMDTKYPDGGAYVPAINKLKVVKLLIKQGALPNATDIRNKKPIDYAKDDLIKNYLSSYLPANGLLALIKNPAITTTPQLDALLLEGLDIDETDEVGNTALHKLAGSNYFDEKKLEVLLNAGMNINCRNNHFSTPLHTAAYFQKDIKALISLVKYGSKLDSIDNYQNTFLHTLFLRQDKLSERQLQFLVDYLKMNCETDFKKILSMTNKKLETPEELLLNSRVDITKVQDSNNLSFQKSVLSTWSLSEKSEKKRKKENLQDAELEEGEIIGEDDQENSGNKKINRYEQF